LNPAGAQENLFDWIILNKNEIYLTYLLNFTGSYC